MSSIEISTPLMYLHLQSYERLSLLLKDNCVEKLNEYWLKINYVLFFRHVIIGFEGSAIFKNRQQYA